MAAFWVQNVYLFYVNEIATLQLRDKLKLFADENLAFYVSCSFGENILRLRNDLPKIAKYFCLNRLTLNLRNSDTLWLQQSGR